MSLPTPEDGSTALITGASSGIGAALAKELAGRGHGVTLVARSEEPLRTLADELASQHGVRAEAIACDVTDPAARDRLAAAAVRGLERGKRVVVPGGPNRVLAAVGRFSPRPVVLRVMDSTYLSRGDRILAVLLPRGNIRRVLDLAGMLDTLVVYSTREALAAALVPADD